MKPEEVKAYWTEQAKEFGESGDASWKDKYMMDLEARTICKHIMKSEHDILDVGCANGYTTKRIARELGMHIHGIDYVPEMIENAKRSQCSSEPTTFSVGDITNLGIREQYHTVYGIRVLINLPDFETQVKAIQECINALKPYGTYLMSEATYQGWQKLNIFREECGLYQISIPKFNTYIDENAIKKIEIKGAKLVRIENFSSSYFVGTRVLKPKFSLLSPNDPDSEFNRFFSEIPSFGDYGIQKLFIWKKYS